MQPLIAFNKPFGVICQFSAHTTHNTLKAFITQPAFYPAGRLDTDSEGLLLLTNSGKLQARITEPRFKLAKTYWAQLEGEITDTAITQLREGVKLKEFTTARAQVERQVPPSTLWARIPPIRERKTVPTSWLALTLTEGKNRQVRRMCAHVGFPCLRLIRVQIGQLNLVDLALPLGKWQFISPSQLMADDIA